MKQQKKRVNRGNKTVKFDKLTVIVAVAVLVFSIAILSIETKNIVGSAIQGSAIRISNVIQIQDDIDFTPDFCEEVLESDFAFANSTKVLGYLVEFNTPALLKTHNNLLNELNEVDKSIAHIARTKSEAIISQAALGIFGNQEIRQLGKLKDEIKQNLRTRIEEHQNIISSEHQSFSSLVSIKKSSNPIKAVFTKSFNGVLLDLSPDEVQKVSQLNYVKSVQPNFQVRALLQDSGEVINAYQVHEIDDGGNSKITGKGIKIAVIDTGIDYTHPDFGSCTTEEINQNNCPKIIDSIDFVNSIDANSDGDFNDPEDFKDIDPMDDNGHGTHVSAIIASQNIPKGIAPDAQIIAYKVLDSNGFGSFADIIMAIEHAVDPNQDNDFSDHADIISMSIGGFGNPDDPVSNAIDLAVEAGVTAVIAAGNAGPFTKSILSPGVARKAITVGAANKCNQIAPFSSRGPVQHNNEVILKPDIIAPGVDICAAQSSFDTLRNNKLSENIDIQCFDDKHIKLQGTSMAAPHVAGAAALLLQVNPELHPAHIKSILTSTSKDLNLAITTQGFGRVNSLNALTPILITIPSSISLNDESIIEIINPNNNEITVNLDAGLAIDQTGDEFQAAQFNQSQLTIKPTSSEFVKIQRLPAKIGGIAVGSARLSVNDNQILLPYGIMAEGPDLGLFGFDKGSKFIIKDKPANLSIVVQNTGSTISNAYTVNLYEFNLENLEEKSLLQSHTRPPLPVGDFEILNFIQNFTSGDKLITFEITSEILSSDTNKENNIYSNIIRVIEDGPDLRLLISPQFSETGIGETVPVLVYIVNEGPKLASNVKFTLHDENANESRFIGTLASEEFQEFSLNITPISRGTKKIIGELTHNGDSVFKSALIFTKANGTDLAIRFNLLDEFDLRLNKSSPLQIIITNNGLQDAVDSTIIITENDEVVATNTIDLIKASESEILEIAYNPSGLGKQKIKVEALNSDEQIPADNSETRIFEVGETIISRFRIFDDEGQNAVRGLRVGNIFTTYSSPIDLELRNIPQPIEISINKKSNNQIQDRTSVTFENSQPAELMDALTVAVKSFSLNHTLFNIIYANNVTWNYTNITFNSLLNLEKASIRNFTLNICSIFSNNTCIGLTKIDAKLNRASTFLNIISTVPNALAFAITEPDFDEDGIPDTIDKDDDNDGIDDQNDKLRCIQGDFESNINLKLAVDRDTNIAKSFSGIKQIRFETSDSKKQPVIVLQHDFSREFDCSKVSITQGKKENSSFILVNGIKNQSKTIFFPQLDQLKRHVCVKDSEIKSINEISDDCSNSDEFIIKCDSRFNNEISCNIANRLIQVNGIKNSGVIQLKPKKTLSNNQSGSTENTDNDDKIRKEIEERRNKDREDRRNKNHTGDEIIFDRRGDDLNFGKVLTKEKPIVIRLNDRVKFLYESRFYVLTLTGISSNSIIFDITRLNNPEKIAIVELPISGQEQLGITPRKFDDILVSYLDIRNQEITISISQVTKPKEVRDRIIEPGRSDNQQQDQKIRRNGAIEGKIERKIESKVDRKTNPKIDSQGENLIDINGTNGKTSQKINDLGADKTRSKIPGIIILLIIISIVIFSAKSIKRRKDRTHKGTSHHEVLDLFVRNLLDQNHSNKEIVRNLHARGWLVRDIAYSIRRCRPKEYQTIDTLITFIENSLNKGFSKSEIGRSLLKKGWSRKVIEKALKGEKELHKFLK